MGETSMWTQAGRALLATGRAAVRPGFWGARLLELVRFDVFLLALAMAAVTAVAFRTGSMQGLFIGVGGFLLLSWLSVPVFMHAWAPPLARESGAAMEVQVVAHEPSLGTVFWWWLRLTLLLVPLVVGGWYLAGRTGLSGFAAYSAFVALAAWLISGFVIRCCLAGVASREQVDALVSATPFTQRLLWLVVCFLVGLGLEWMAYQVIGGVITPAGLAFAPGPAVVTAAAIGLVAGTIIGLLVLALWAALVVQRLAPQDPDCAATLVMGDDGHAGGPRPAAAARRLPWGAIALLLVGAAIAAAWWGRLTLLDSYMRARYPHAYLGAPAHYDSNMALQLARKNFACAGSTPQMKLLSRFGVGHDLISLQHSLACAARHGHHEAVLYLLDEGAEVNAAPPRIASDPTMSGRTALQEAAAGGHAQMVATLLQRGADPRQATHSGTALHLAARKGDLGIVAQLVKAGARDDDSRSEVPVVSWAAAHRRAVPPEQRLWRQHVASAQAAGLTLAAKDMQGRTLLHWAAGQGDLELVEVLLERGLSPADEDVRGALPLMYLVNALEGKAPQETIELRAIVRALSEGQQQLGRPLRKFVHVSTDREQGWPSFSDGWAITAERLGEPWMQDLLGPWLEAPAPLELPPAAPLPGIVPASTLRL